MCDRTFVIVFGDEILGKTDDYNQAYDYLIESFGEKAINLDNYNVYCQGLLEEWIYYDNPKVRIIDHSKKNIDPLQLIENIKEEVTRIPKPVKVEKNLPTTPTRTRLVTNTKSPPVNASKLKEGTIKKGNDGSMWINKKFKNGSFKWVRYYEETHEGLERKRKAPSHKAKEYKVGTIMTGVDGNQWIVKRVREGVFKWVKHN